MNFTYYHSDPRFNEDGSMWRTDRSTALRFDSQQANIVTFIKNVEYLTLAEIFIAGTQALQDLSNQRADVHAAAKEAEEKADKARETLFKTALQKGNSNVSVT